MATRCHAVIAFIHIQAILTLALYPGKHCDEEDGLLIADKHRPELGYLSPWLHHIRQGCQMVCGFWDTVSNGPLGNLANSWEIPTMAEDETSSRIAEVLTAVTRPGGLGYRWPDEQKRCYSHAAADLSIALSGVYKLGETLTIWDAIRLWPLILSEDFIVQLKNLSPGALLLVACYTVALEKLDTVWFARDVHSTLRSNVYRHLDESMIAYAEQTTAPIQATLHISD